MTKKELVKKLEEFIDDINRAMNAKLPVLMNSLSDLESEIDSLVIDIEANGIQEDKEDE